MNNQTICKIALVVMVFSLSSCHVKISSTSYMYFGQLHNPKTPLDTMDMYEKPTPYDYVEQLYLSPDSTFIHVLLGDFLNLEPVYGRYSIKGKKIKLYPDFGERSSTERIYFKKSNNMDSLFFSFQTTWGYENPKIGSFEVIGEDTTYYLSTWSLPSKFSIPKPNNLDTIVIRSEFSDHNNVILTSEILNGNNNIDVKFGMRSIDYYRIKYGEIWKFSKSKKKIKQKGYKCMGKEHPYYYRGKHHIEIKN